MTGSHNLRVVSLNVNGLSNPVKRSSVGKNEKGYFYKRHMLKQEHDKLKKFGYLNSFFSSFKNSRNSDP